MNIDQLNHFFGLPGELDFFEAENGLVFIRIANRHATAIVSTYGGQVLSWLPDGRQSNVLFVSEKAYFEVGKAIKGGVPVCWPWFGIDPENRGRGSHGFVRNRQWSVRSAESTDSGSTLIRMSVDISDVQAETWAYSCELVIEIEVGQELHVSLITENTGSHDMPLSQALHSYLAVEDVNRVVVSGLDGAEYIDAVDGYNRKKQSGDVSFSCEVDRIYQTSGQALYINNTSEDNSVSIRSEGSKSVVVWNPWVDKSRSMADFAEREFMNMVCVETANAGDDVRLLKPGSSHRLSAILSVS